MIWKLSTNKLVDGLRAPLLAALTVSFFCCAAALLDPAAAWAQPRRSREAADDDQSVWMSDYVKARRVAREQNKPMMVVFRCVP